MRYNNQFYPNYGYQQPTYQQNQSIQNGGFMMTPNEDMARTFPVAHGTSVTFRDENLPYIYCKTLGFSQMDLPIFEKYRLVKEEESDSPAQKPDTAESPSYITKSEFEAVRNELRELKDIVDNLRKELGDEHI